MRVLKFYILLILLLPLGALAQTQAPVDSTLSKSIIQHMDAYSAKHPVEKAYLQFDKPYYAAGDTIYFKAYVTLGGTNELSALSGVLHVELIDNTAAEIKQSENLQITNGVAWGDFALPDSLPQGSYRVRAYTQLMRNNGEAGFFEQNFLVAGIIVPQLPAEAKPKAKPDVQFFPEGGVLVPDVQSKIGFKAIGPNGLGLEVSGIILDNENKLVRTFSSTHLGMGYFTLTPRVGKTYTAKITYPDTSTAFLPLPATDSTGIVMSVKNDSTADLTINFDAGTACYQANKGKVYVLAVYSGGSLVNIPIRLDDLSLSYFLSKKKLHTGVTRFTLFSPGGEPLSERLVFIQNHDQLKLSISSDKKTYAEREKVTVQLTAATQNGLPAGADFSVAVTDENRVPLDENSGSTILNNLLLSSDIKGYIEQPEYYFADSTSQTLRNLDILLLTQGYRGFTWKQVLNDTSKINYPIEKMLSLSGTVETLNNKPIPHGKVTLAYIKQMVLRDTTAGANGKFKFDNLYITDTAKLLLRAGSGKRNMKVFAQAPVYPNITPVNGIDTLKITNPKIVAALQKQYNLRRGMVQNSIMLKEIKVNSKRNPLRITQLSHSQNLNGPGMADQVIMGSQLVGCTDVRLCIIDLLGNGVRFIGDTIYSTHTQIQLKGPTKPMAVLIDGVIEDQSGLSTIAASDVSSVEILESHTYTAIYGSEAAGGLIVVNTKAGGESRPIISIQPGLTTYTFKGFYRAHEFYSPKYEVSAATPVKSTDLRSTILWKPVILTGTDGKASFDFYNADGAGTYRVVIEGIDANGHIGRQVYRYKVE